MVEFIEIEELNIIEYDGYVYDLEVENDHTYTANEYIVHNCTTSTNTAINYPQASLISDMVSIKEHLKLSNPYMKLPKIVADGGIRNFCDVIKALSIGADYVMIGGIFGKLLESASPCIMFTENGTQEVSGLALKMQEDFKSEGNGVFLIDGKPT